MRSRRPTPIVSFLAFCCAAASAARAGEVVYGPDGAPTVVQRKLHTMSNRWEAGLTLGAALNSSLVDHYGGVFSVTYHPNEWADFGVDMVANYTRLSGLGAQVREQLPPRTNPQTGAANSGDDLQDADQMRGAVLAVGRVAPIYGKLNLASEASVHFQAYGLAGAGVGLFRHESVDLCASPGSAVCPADSFARSTAAKPVGEVGAGMRFYLSQAFSVRAELRAFLHPASVVRGADLTRPGTGTTERYLGVLTVVGLGASALF
jgi:outer membrane beta-barrel protein